MANTRDTMGEQACLDALVANTLTDFEDDGISKVGKNALRYHTALTSVTMSNCTGIGESGLGNCSNLEVVDIKGTGSIGSYALANNNKLKHLIMRGTTLPSTFSYNALKGTPIVAGQGCIYVRPDILNAYKSNDSMGKKYTFRSYEDYPCSTADTIDDSWSDIVTSCNNGTYASKYAIGDVKSMVIDGTIHYFQLVAKDADVLASDGVATVPTTWLTYKSVSISHRMNPANSSGTQGTGANGGWEYSEMRAWLNDTILPLLPSEVRTNIKEVRKYSNYVIPGESTVTNDQITSDKLWIPSANEVYSGIYEQSGVDYRTYYSGDGVRIKYSDSSYNDMAWWLRSAASDSEFHSILSSGSLARSSAPNVMMICLGFCI